MTSAVVKSGLQNTPETEKHEPADQVITALSVKQEIISNILSRKVEGTD